MHKNGYFASLLILGCTLLTGCITDVWTGANLVYDRHNIYLKLNDFQLAANASRALYYDKLFKRPDCSIQLAVINRDILMVGRVPTTALRQEAYARIAAVPGKRRFFNQLDINQTIKETRQDNWITTKIRGQIFADADIDPHQFTVVTSGGIVYLMGDVIPEQADKVIRMASECDGVKRVVKLLKYYKLSDSEH